jgi:hypothetical protein
MTNNHFITSRINTLRYLAESFLFNGRRCHFQEMAVKLEDNQKFVLTLLPLGQASVGVAGITRYTVIGRINEFIRKYLCLPNIFGTNR